MVERKIPAGSGRPPRRPVKEDASYAVGYGKPPHYTRFKPGRSGNPRGRPKGVQNFASILDDVLNAKVSVHEGVKSRSITKREALVLSITNRALTGDAKALTSLLLLLRHVGVLEEAEPELAAEAVTVDDSALIAEYLARHGAELPRTEASLSPGNEPGAPGAPNRSNP